MVSEVHASKPGAPLQECEIKWSTAQGSQAGKGGIGGMLGRTKLEDALAGGVGRIPMVEARGPPSELRDRQTEELRTLETPKFHLTAQLCATLLAIASKLRAVSSNRCKVVLASVVLSRIHLAAPACEATEAFQSSRRCVPVSLSKEMI